MKRIWKNSGKKIISNTASMYGELEGLAGPALPPMKILELPNQGDDAYKDEGV